ncbi:glucose-1-phosphate adenylyltransferase family protein [Demetria terragena]|uniref:glucose-1-phosphate adenylyltransferase family protein n=1 Tax=Demetria terragena TaxID=63959 RepID=UPI0004771B98|nr:sugar phosphate nucleotidyltransferase [Demetria terragena]
MRENTLAIVQAGGQGSRMGVLTKERAKPALPFGGSYQLVDFPLTNLHHSGIEQVWLCLQYQADSLHDLVANGRPWDLDRTRGGLRLVFPRQTGDTGGDLDEGFATGNADQLYRIREDISGSDADVVLVMSADHIYRLDYQEVLRTHRESGAECTVVTTVVSSDAEASAHATVTTTKTGKVKAFAYKPSKPSTRTIATEVFAYDRKALVRALEELGSRLSDDSDHDDSGLGDFGDHLIPWFVGRGKTFAHAQPGYWLDVGRPETYLEAHRDLLGGKAAVFDSDWPILTQQPQREAARIHRGALIEDSLLSPGAVISGTVRRSVIGPGVVVERDAVVSDSILFADSVVRAKADVAWSILDERVTVGRGAKIGGRPRKRPVPSESITMLGTGARVRAGGRVELGNQLEPRARR